MYRKKLFFFGLMTSIILIIALSSASISAYLTRLNLQQSSVAQSLAIEHQRLSSVSYRLFKQFTDEYIFGSNANQANVRKKKSIIQQSLSTIRELEIIQREALGKKATQGSVEDTDELESIIQQIMVDFSVLLTETEAPVEKKRERLRYLLEVQIDNLFREAIDSAVARQGRVIAALNSRIEMLNVSILWFTVGLGVVSLCLIIYGCFWLFTQLFQPLVLIKNATDSIAARDYNRPITEKLDDEFEALVFSINSLGKRLQEHEAKEAESRRELEFQVEQRTAELTQANLQLTKLDSRRRQFINDISHELRTPLTIIRGESQITLRMSSPNENDYRDTLNSVLHQAVDLSRLVDDLLLLARAEMNKLHLDLSLESILPILDVEVEKWRKQAVGRDILFNVAPNLASVQLSIDAHRIHQVMSVLLDNAIKYSSEADPINVSAAIEGDEVLVSIRDQGKGISGAEIEHIFERFVRFSKHRHGIGLGLSIAKAIIDAHDGKIIVDSSPGQGSTFSFSLPLGNQ